MKKILIALVIAVAVIVIAAAVTVTLLLDSAIKKGVETVGPQIARVDVKLDSVSLSLLSGSAKLKNLVVGNPDGFKTPHAIRVGKASVSVSPGSLFAEKVLVKSIRIEAPEITYEGGLLGGDNNLRKILNNVNAATSGSGTGRPAPTEPSPGESKPGKKLQVDDILITGARVNVSLKDAGGFAAPVVLPDIHLTDLGQGPEGITSAELTRRILAEVTDGALRSAATEIGKGVVKEATKEAGKKVKGLMDSLQKNK